MHWDYRNRVLAQYVALHYLTLQTVDTRSSSINLLAAGKEYECTAFVFFLHFVWSVKYEIFKVGLKEVIYHAHPDCGLDGI
jgi:hypothetical protein